MIGDHTHRDDMHGGKSNLDIARGIGSRDDERVRLIRAERHRLGREDRVALIGLTDLLAPDVVPGGRADACRLHAALGVVGRKTGTRRSHLVVKLARKVNARSPVKAFTTRRESGKNA